LENLHNDFTGFGEYNFGKVTSKFLLESYEMMNSDEFHKYLIVKGVSDIDDRYYIMNKLGEIKKSKSSESKESKDVFRGQKGKFLSEEEKEKFWKMIIDYHKDKIHETIKSMQQYRNQTPFLNRDKFKTQSYSIYQSCKDAYKQNIKEGIPKQRITIGNIMGGAGQGKTRACLELVNILKEKYEDDIILSVRFEFYNGSMLRGFENTNSASSIFGLRILLAFLGYLHISQFGEYTTSNLGISIEQLFYSEIFSINSVFAKISPILHDYFKTNKSKTIYLIVIADEYNQLYKAFKDKWKLPAIWPSLQVVR
jgi:hypothetical protein